MKPYLEEFTNFSSQLTFFLAKTTDPIAYIYTVNQHENKNLFDL